MQKLLSGYSMHKAIYPCLLQFTEQSNREEQVERKRRMKIGAKKLMLIIVVVLLAIVILYMFLQLGSSMNKKPEFDVYMQIELLNSERDENEKLVVETTDWNIIKSQADAVGIVSIEMDSWNEFKESLRQHETSVSELGIDYTIGIVWFIDGPLFYYRYY
jgi:cell division protein FtsL